MVGFVCLFALIISVFLFLIFFERRIKLGIRGAEVNLGEAGGGERKENYLNTLYENEF